METPVDIQIRSAAASEALFFGGFAIAIVVTVAAGFAPSFYLRGLHVDPAPLLPLLLAHGVLFTAWILLFPLQMLLVRTGRITWHRRVGVAALLIAVSMAVTALSAQTARSRRVVLDGTYAENPLRENLLAMLTIVPVIVFLALVTLAILWRRRPAVHKRLMLLATATLTGPALIRLPILQAVDPMVVIVMPCLYVLPLLVFDRWTLGRVLPVSGWGVAAFVAYHPFAFLLAGSPAAIAFARWAAS